MGLGLEFEALDINEDMLHHSNKSKNFLCLTEVTIVEILPPKNGGNQAIYFFLEVSQCLQIHSSQYLKHDLGT